MTAKAHAADLVVAYAAPVDTSNAWDVPDEVVADGGRPSSDPAATARSPGGP
ncbi:hypothetical protein ACFXA4_03990 [Streptomyces sp. NPDC059442]|uniref:hypothetical protein n=1 Tax=Streptomyces sp. NPDC059442 TaxID=3346830 RepID=UPI0036995CB8